MQKGTGKCIYVHDSGKKEKRKQAHDSAEMKRPVLKLARSMSSLGNVCM